MTEPEVLQKVHRFLREGRLPSDAARGASGAGAGAEPWPTTDLSRLYTDAHGTLVGLADLKPFQRFSLDLGDRVVHPDLVGQFADGETLLAVEGKGDRGLTKGLAQAQQYQEAFHLSFLAADAAAIGSSVERFARRQNLGLLGVSDEVRVLHAPRPRQPWKRPWQSIRSQMALAGEVAGHNTFLYNLPTHYLVWPVALQPGQRYTASQLRSRVVDYPMPQKWTAALRGAQKLGLVRKDGEEAYLTTTGEAVRAILDTSVGDWAAVHGAAKRAPLAQCAPRAAGVLRLLLMRSPMTQLLVEALRGIIGGRATLDQLAQKCSELDHGRAIVLFFIPERLDPLTDSRGRIVWNRVSGDAYRPTTSFQYKSMLKHAGIIQDTGLGGSNVAPEDDVWVLSSLATRGDILGSFAGS